MDKRFINLLTKFSKSDISNQGYDFFYNKKDNLLHLDKQCLKTTPGKKINLTLAQLADKNVHLSCFRVHSRIDPALDDLVSKCLGFESIFKKNATAGLNFQFSLLLEAKAIEFLESVESTFTVSTFSPFAGKYLNKLEKNFKKLENSITESISCARQEIYTLASLNLLGQEVLKEGILPLDLKFKAFRAYINYPSLLSDDLLSKIFIRKFALQSLCSNFTSIADLNDSEFENLINEFDALIDQHASQDFAELEADFIVDAFTLDKNNLSISTIALALLRIHGIPSLEDKFTIKSLPVKFASYLKVGS